MLFNAIRALKLSRTDPPFFALTLALSGTYILSLGILVLDNRSPDLPWSFVPFLLLLCLPCALVIVGVTNAAWRFPKVPAAMWIAIGVAAVWFSTPHILWPISALAVIVAVRELRSIRFAGRLALLIVLLALGYAAVWNFNSILAPLSVGRLGDPWLIAVDRWLLSATSYSGVFPVFQSPWTFRLLERSYLFLFTEILTVTLWLAAFRPDHAFWWIARLFTAYAIGLLAFLVWPTVGPHIYAPESLRAEWHHTLTFSTMQTMAVDYGRIVSGGRGGMNYFIAFPSLHVAAAVICQIGVRDSGVLFWVLLPVTVLVASSTFLIGYHYALDVPAGIVTALAASGLMERLRRQDDSRHPVPVPAAGD